MFNPFSPDDCVEVLHGDFFSVFCDQSRNYWAVSNDFSSVFQGPFSFELARKIMISANEFYNAHRLKGL